MAGSLNHIVEDDGSFTMETIENLGDAHEALEECHQIIAALVIGREGDLERVCDAMAYPVPAVPKLDENLWGHESNRVGQIDRPQWR